MNDPAGMARIVAAMPDAAKALVLGGWLSGAIAGRFTAATIARRAWAGWVPAGVVIAAGIANLFLIPHPLWMAAGAIVVPVLGGWLAGGEAGAASNGLLRIVTPDLSRRRAASRS